MTRGLTLPCNPHRVTAIIAKPGTKVLFYRRTQHTKMVCGAADVTDHEIIEELNWRADHRVLEVVVQGEVKN